MLHLQNILYLYLMCTILVADVIIVILVSIFNEKKQQQTLT